MANPLLAELRKRRGLTKAETARLAGITKQSYGRIESGAAIGSVPTMRKIQRALRATDSQMWRTLK
ncbi:MAG: helix-turn-helix transcriptional regulator [Sphaerochaetaceae bacterium]